MRLSTKISSHIYKYEWHKHSLDGENKSKISIPINLTLRPVKLATKMKMEMLKSLISTLYFKIFTWKI